MSFPIKLEVVSSKDVKSKKRWRRIQWDGEESENISLLGSRTLAQFNLVTGKKKRVDGSIRRVLGKVVQINGSTSGKCVVGMLQDGHLFRWRKNTRTITNISPCPGFNPTASVTPADTKNRTFRKPKLFISDDGSTIFLFSRHSGVYVWKGIEHRDSGWTRVVIGNATSALLSAKDIAMDVVFYTDKVSGPVVMCAYVSSTGDCISVGILTIHTLQQWSPPSYVLFKYPYSDFTPRCTSTRLKDSLLPCWARNGKVLAVAVNQRRPSLARILLIEPKSGGVINCGFTKVLQSAVEMSFWISSLSWTCNNLFLACSTTKGAVLLLSANGNVMQIVTKSPAEKFGPGLFLPLEGFVGFRRPTHNSIPRDIDESTDTSIQSTAVPPKLRKPYFSVSAHPTLPILLCGDGYSVAAIKIMDGVSHKDMILIGLGETMQRIERTIKGNQLQVTILEPLSYFTHPSSKMFRSEQEQHWREMIKNTHNRLLLDTTAHQDIDLSKEDSPEQEALLSFLIEDLDDSRLAYSEKKEESIKDSLIEDATANLLQDLTNCHRSLLSNLMLLSLSLEDSSPYQNQLFTEPLATRVSDSELVAMFVRTFKLFCDILLQLQEIADVYPLEMLSESFIPRNSNPASLRDVISDAISSLARGILSLLSWDNLSRSVHSVFCIIIQEMVDTMLMDSRKSSEGCLCRDDVLANFLQTFLFLDKAEACITKQISSFSRALFNDPTSFGPTITNEENPSAAAIEQDHRLDHSNQLHFPLAWQTLLTYATKLQGNGLQSEKESKLVDHVVCFLQRRTLDQTVSSVECSSVDDISATRVLLSVCKSLRSYDLSSAMSFAFRNLCWVIPNQKKWTDEKWLAVEVLGRIMASYFCGAAVTVPSLTGALSESDNINSFQGHFVTLQQEKIVAAIRAQSLDESWSIDNAILLLLSCGRVMEASIIASDVGDWRTAFVLSALVEKTSFSNSMALRGASEPVSWNIESLLKSRFRSILSSVFGLDVDITEDFFLILDGTPQSYAEIDPSAYLKCFRDVLEVSAMVGVDIATWSCISILNTLKSKCMHKVPLLIPLDFNLPHPQLYLPQSSADLSTTDAETKLRNEVSCYARILLGVLNSIGIQRVLALWYLKYLDRESACNESHHDSCCQRREAQNSLADYSLLKDVTIQGLELKHDRLHGNPSNDDIYLLAAAFRELCSILWMINVRDKLASAVRKYQALREKFGTNNKHLSEADSDPKFSSNIACDEILETIQECLLWIRKIQPFAKFMHLEAELEELILCIMSELPLNVNTAILLAEFFHDERLTTPKTKHRLGIFVKKLQKVQVLRPPAQETIPLSACFNEECRKLSQQRRFLFSGHFSTPKLQTDLKSTGETSQTNTLSRDEPSVISRLTPDNLLATLENCYAFEADGAYHKFVFELIEIVLSKSPASATFTPKKEHKSRPTSKPLSYPLVLAYRNEIAKTKLEMIAPQKVEESSILSMKVPVAEKIGTNTSSGMNSIENDVLHDSGAASEDLETFTAFEWKFFRANKSAIGSHNDKRKFSVQTREIPCIDFEGMPLQFNKRLQRLVPYFAWLDHWRCQLVPIPKNLSHYKQGKPAMRISVSTEHLIHGFTIAELRFGKHVKRKERKEEKTEVTQSLGPSTLHSDKVAEPTLNDLPDGRLTHSPAAIVETVPKVIEESHEESEVTAKPLQAEAIKDNVVAPSDLHSISHEIDGGKTLEGGQNTLDQAPQIQLDERVNQEAHSEEVTDGSLSRERGKDKVGEAETDKADLEAGIPHPSAGNLFRKILHSDKMKEGQGQTSDVMSHSAISVASTGLQSDLMPDGGGRIRKSRVLKKERDDKREMQDLVQKEIRDAMAGQQVLFLAQIFQSMMMQASNFMAQSQHPASVPIAPVSMQQSPSQKPAQSISVPELKTPAQPEVQPASKKGDGRLQILSLDGEKSFILPKSRYSQKPGRPPLALLTEARSLKKSQTVYLEDEKSSPSRMFTPMKMRDRSPETVPVMYTGPKQPYSSKQSLTKETKPSKEHTTLGPTGVDGSSTLTPEMLQEPAVDDKKSCPTCHSHPAPKATVRLPLLSLADAVAAKSLGQSQHVRNMNAFPRLINIRQVLRYEQKRMAESGQQSQSVVHIGKALPLLSAENIPGLYKVRPKFREVPFTIPPAQVEPKVQVKPQVKSTAPEETSGPLITDESRVEIPKELLPTVLTEEEAEEIRNGVLMHYKTIVDQQKLMWRESGQQTEDLDDEKQDMGVGPSPEHSQLLHRRSDEPRADRYGMHEEFLDRFLHVDGNQVADRENIPTRDLKAQDVTQMQGPEANLRVPAVQTLVKSRWSSAMDQMSSEMDAVTEMDRDIRYRIPYEDERIIRTSDRQSTASSTTIPMKVYGRPSSESAHSDKTSIHSAPKPTVPTYIPPSEMLSGVEKRFSQHEPLVQDHDHRPSQSRLDELAKYRRKIDEAFSLAEFGPRRDPSDHSLVSSRQITPASSMHKMDGSVVSSLSWDELEAMVRESIPLDAGEERATATEMTGVDNRIQDALQLLDELEGSRANVDKSVTQPLRKKSQISPKRFNKKREADVDARIEDAMSLLREIKADQKQIKTGGKATMMKSTSEKTASMKSGGLDRWTLEAMSLLNELKSEYEPESRVAMKENLSPQVLGKSDSEDMRAHIEQAMALLQDNTSGSPASLQPSSHVSFQPTSQMPRRYY